MSVYLLYMQSASTESLVERLSQGDKDNAHIELQQLGNRIVEQGDLIIVMEKGEFHPLLVAIGKAVSDYEITENGKVIPILFDFIIGKQKDFTQFYCLIKEANIDLNEIKEDVFKIPDALVEKRIKRFPLVYKNYKEGEIIDKDLIDLTNDKSVTHFPGLVLDWNLLFDIVRPRA